MSLVKYFVENSNNIDELVESLAKLISSNFDIVRASDGKLQLLERRAHFAQINGLKIEVYSNEHPPPHFHVKSSDVDAVFDLNTGIYLRGLIQPRHKRLIEYWYPEAKDKLIQFWESRQQSKSKGG